MNYSSRFWLFAPLALFLALAAWAMGYWWVSASALDRKLTALNGHDAVPGIVLSYGSKRISGFPFNLDVVFTDFSVAGRGAHGPFRWHSEKFALHRLTYGRAQDIYEAAGRQTLQWTDGEGRGHRLSFLPATLRASAIANAKGLARFDLDIVDAGGTDTDGVAFTAGRLQFHLRRDPNADAVDVAVRADMLSRKDMPLFGDQIRNLLLYARVSPGAAFAPLLAGKASWPAAAAAWAGQGGKVAFGPVAIQSAALSLRADRFADSDGDLRKLLDGLY